MKMLQPEYDSAVNELSNPEIFVIFNKDIAWIYYWVQCCLKIAIDELF